VGYYVDIVRGDNTEVTISLEGGGDWERKSSQGYWASSEE
jgi:hypothetical protein